MKYYRIKNILEQENEPALPKVDRYIFKFIHQLKEKLTSKNEILNRIREFLPSVGKSSSEALSYLESFSLNYRPDGRYDLITKDEFKDINKLKPKRTTNVGSGDFVGGQIPFNGSNLSGQWEVDNSGNSQYVVLSYGWYPVLIYKENRWFINNDSYSSSTAKQISQASRGSRDEILLSRTEMEKLRNATLKLSDIPSEKLRKFIQSEKPSLELRPTRFITWGWRDDAGKVKFVIEDIIEEDGKAKFKIRIINAGKRDGQKMVIDPENPYTDDNIPGVTKQDVEDAIKRHFTNTYRVYAGGRGMIDQNFFEFEFKHPNE